MSGYLVILVDELRPGEWVMDFPRDRQVESIGTGGRPKELVVFFTDGSREFWPSYMPVFVSCPVLKRPWLALQPDIGTDEARFTAFCTDVVGAARAKFNGEVSNEAAG